MPDPSLSLSLDARMHERLRSLLSTPRCSLVFLPRRDPFQRSLFSTKKNLFDDCAIANLFVAIKVVVNDVDCKIEKLQC